MTQDVFSQEKLDLPDPKSRQKWWQLLLVSPVLAGLFTASIPTILQAISSVKRQVPYEAVPYAEQQNRLWARNLNCLEGTKATRTTTNGSVIVDLRLCPSGDIQVTLAPGSPVQRIHWIGANVLSENALTNILMSPVIAAPLPSTSNTSQSKQSSASPTIICTKSLGEGRLLQRLRYPDGRCEDQVINTFTGTVVSRNTVTCSSNCN